MKIKKVNQLTREDNIEFDSIGICPCCGKVYAADINKSGIEIFPFMDDSTPKDLKVDESRHQILNLQDLEFGISEAALGFLVRCTDCADKDRPGSLHFVIDSYVSDIDKYLELAFALSKLTKALGNANMTKNRVNLSLSEFGWSAFKIEAYSYGIAGSKIIYDSYMDSMKYFNEADGEVARLQPKLDIGGGACLGIIHYDITLPAVVRPGGSLELHPCCVDWIKEFTKCLEKNTKKAYTKRGRNSKKEK